MVVVFVSPLTALTFLDKVYSVTIPLPSVLLTMGFISAEPLAVKSTISNVSNIRANLDSIITAGGTSANSQASSDLDFTYILYAQSSADATATSAYIYTGTYGVERADAGTAMTDTSLKIMGIAEIDAITSGALTSAQIISTKPGTLDQ